MELKLISITIILFSIYLIYSYVYDLESSKKHWQKGKPYQKVDKIFGISLGIAFIILAIFIFVKSF